MAGRNISNSEVVAWLSCRLQYFFAHYRNLEPKEMGVPLYRGNVGHEFFQRYAEARINGKNHDDSMRYGTDVFTREMQKRPEHAETIMQTMYIVNKYMAYHKGWPEWRILSVEQRFDLPLTDDFHITIRYDTMVEEIATGKILIGDFKFTYDFWSPLDHSLNGQMPKYISVMNANGMQVHGGFLEELRTRKLSEKNGNADNPRMLWRRTPYNPTPITKRNMLRQHIAASLEITEYRSLSDADREAKSIPVLNKHGACKYCNFKEVCAIKLNGGDWEFELERNFQPNTYGYNEMEPDL